MNITDETKVISSRMQGQWSFDHVEHGFNDVIVPFYALLAELVNTDDPEAIRYGAIDNEPGGYYRALLVTKTTIIYAAFQILSVGEPGNTTAETADGYNLQIIPRSRLNGVTVNNIEHSQFVGELTGATYNIHFDSLDIEMPIRQEYRNRTEELELLKELTNSLS